MFVGYEIPKQGKGKQESENDVICNTHERETIFKYTKFFHTRSKKTTQ